MNIRKADIFLFSIANEVQRSFEYPVILFTEKDYADCVFRSLIDMRLSIQENAKPERVLDIVTTLHYSWLEAVQDLEKVKKRLKDIPREVIFKALEYTIKYLDNRYQNLCKYIEQMKSALSDDEIQLMDANLEIIQQVEEINHSALLEKRKQILLQADQAEYLSQISDEIEELLNWLDRLYGNLALQYAKVLHLRNPSLPRDLTNTLKLIIEEVSVDPDPETQKIADLINLKESKVGQLNRIASESYELEIKKTLEKIKALEHRISRLQVQKSSALMALQHKTIYLEDRIQSLENMKLATYRLQNENVQTQDTTKSEDERIFNHILPHHDRCRLVEQLVSHWGTSVAERDHESIISILSSSDLKDIFSDEMGQFTIDKYGRKIYTKDDDDNFFQLNEKNELVVVNDDHHIYFYDECGRYYINDVRQRVYRDHDDASEYILSKNGGLVKVKEVRDGTAYFYDWLGRYYINDKGKQIYREEDATSEYEHDGLGNLVRLNTTFDKNEDNYSYPVYTKKSLTIEENIYLEQVVGPALKKCIAKVIIQQPLDPIAYLAESLIKYRKNIIEKQVRLDNEREMCENQFN